MNKKTLKIIKISPAIIQGVILVNMGYDVTTWQWWAIAILTAIGEILYVLDY